MVPEANDVLFPARFVGGGAQTSDFIGRKGGTRHFPISLGHCVLRMEARNVEELEEEMDVDK